MTDVGFNSGEAGLDSYWVKEGDGTAAIAKSQYNNPMLKLDGEVSVTQEITYLVPGKNYVVYIGVDNRSDRSKIRGRRVRFQLYETFDCEKLCESIHAQQFQRDSGQQQLFPKYVRILYCA